MWLIPAITLAVCLVRLGFSTQQHLICKNVENVFAEGNISNMKRGLRGQTGKQGPIGPRGPPGSKGEPGVASHIDLSIIQIMIDESIAEERQQRSVQIEALRNELFNTTIAATGAHSRCILRGRAIYLGEKCYTVFISAQRSTRLEQAERQCAETDASLANVGTRDVLLALLDFVRGHLPSAKDEWQLWLGMTYDTSDRSLRSSNGQPIEAGMIWDLSYPSNIKSATNIVLEIDRTPASSQGLWNSAPRADQHGAICES